MSKVRDRLVTSGLVERALSLGMDPLELSIKKWERVCKWTDGHPLSQEFVRENFGYATCGLCMVYYRRWEDDSCKECPLAQHGWGCLEEGSPYAQVMDAMDDVVSPIYIEGAMDRFKLSCQEMLSALKSLRNEI